MEINNYATTYDPESGRAIGVYAKGRNYFLLIDPKFNPAPGHNGKFLVPEHEFDEKLQPNERLSEVCAEAIRELLG